MKRLIVLFLILMTLVACSRLLTDEEILSDPAMALSECLGKKGDSQVECLGNLKRVFLENDAVEQAVIACKGLGNAEEKDVCFWEIADLAGSEEGCRGLSKEEDKNDCLFDIGVDKRSANLCKEITDKVLKDDCLYEISKRDQGIASCQAMDSATKRNDCLDTFVKNTVSEDLDEALRACELMTIGKDDCYWTVIKIIIGESVDDDIKVCKKMSIGTDDCLLDVSRTWAGKNLDESFGVCQDMGNTINQDSCINELIGKASNVLSDPDRAINWCEEHSDKDYCYESVAKSLSGKNNLKADEACKKINDAYLKSDCLRNY